MKKLNDVDLYLFEIIDGLFSEISSCKVDPLSQIPDESQAIIQAGTRYKQQFKISSIFLLSFLYSQICQNSAGFKENYSEYRLNSAKSC